jgi:hypothetical protein
MLNTGLLHDFIGRVARRHVFGNNLISGAIAPDLVGAFSVPQKTIAVLF